MDRNRYGPQARLSYPTLSLPGSAHRLPTRTPLRPLSATILAQLQSCMQPSLVNGTGRATGIYQAKMPRIYVPHNCSETQWSTGYRQPDQVLRSRDTYQEVRKKRGLMAVQAPMSRCGTIVRVSKIMTNFINRRADFYPLKVRGVTYSVVRPTHS